jgi:hypothetical protein
MQDFSAGAKISVPKVRSLFIRNSPCRRPYQFQRYLNALSEPLPNSDDPIVVENDRPGDPSWKLTEPVLKGRE